MTEEKDLTQIQAEEVEEVVVTESIHLTARESSRISRENRRITNEIEKKRNRRNVPKSEYTAVMRDPNNVVEFDNVHTFFFTDIGTVKAVDGVTFDVPKGKTVGVVGESGCGKSVTALSLMQLVQRPQGQTVEGQIRFNGEDMVYDIAQTPTDRMEKIRGAQISMIFQEPMTSLNPVFRAGHQIDEVIKLHNPEMTNEEVKAQTLKMIDMVGIANQEGVYMMYPHELSGGMRQRIMIAMALAMGADLIIAVDLNHDIVTTRLSRPHPFANGKPYTQAMSRMLESLQSLESPALAQFSAWLHQEPLPGIFDVLLASIYVMQARITQATLRHDKPEILIRPPLGAVRFMEFDRAEEIIEIGYRSAAGHLAGWTGTPADA